MIWLCLLVKLLRLAIVACVGYGASCCCVVLGGGGGGGGGGRVNASVVVVVVVVVVGGGGGGGGGGGRPLSFVCCNVFLMWSFDGGFKKTISHMGNQTQRGPHKDSEPDLS